MLIHRPNVARDLFGDLWFVVLDEIYAFMSQDRGLQTMCLPTRLERRTSAQPGPCDCVSASVDPADRSLVGFLCVDGR